MNKLNDFMKARALLAKHGHYDTTIAGAIGEAYAEEVLGMVKADARTKGYDGMLNGRKLQVKAKMPREEYEKINQHYAAISHKNVGHADDMLVVMISPEGKLSHLGPMAIDDMKFTKNDVERRYFLGQLGKPIIQNWKK